MRLRGVVVTAVFLMSQVALQAAVQQGNLTLELQTLASGLQSPLTVTNAGDERLFIAEQTGKIKIYRHGSILATPFLDIASKLTAISPNYDERGLLGLAFHPNYKTTGKFYVYYSAPATSPGYDHRSVISEFTVSGNPDVADLSSERVLLSYDEPQMNHNGGDLHFGPDGYLYISSGDGGNGGDVGFGHTDVTGNGQDKTKFLGKLLRIDVDRTQDNLEYAIPDDNPFVADSSARPETFCLGLRNPWRFSFDRLTGALLLPDVGQENYEEINIAHSGDNLGWRAREGFHVYDASLYNSLITQGVSFADPIAEYTHDDGISITGGFVYRGQANPALRGRYIFGDLANRFFYLGPSEPSPVQIYEFQYGPGAQAQRPVYIKGFGEGADGELYVAVAPNTRPSDTKGRVLRILPQVMTVGAARRFGAGTAVNLAGKTVTRALSDRYYIEETDRSAGIAVMLSRNYTAGTLVNVSGTVNLHNGELVISSAADAVAGSGAPIARLDATNQSAAADLAQGLLLRVWGRVVASDGSNTIRIDDGSLLSDVSGDKGLRIILASGISQPEAGSYVSVTGPRGSLTISGSNVPALWVADNADMVAGP
ncbi:MAG: PQQ-dependent sugar dehydrogenase [Armatimonadetes bacterium]|nr:PQQ-dependent sugar dehydrogenase [Armatimonadota bacterium]